jgi:vacuolar-type H+-ATPase subunit H
MEKTINQLFEIEEKANQIITRANEQKSKLIEDFEREISEMEKNIAEENTAKLRSLQEQINEELTKELNELMQESENRLNNLQKINQNEHEALVDQIFQNIIHS